MKRLILIIIFIFSIFSCQKIFKEDKQNNFNLNTKDDYNIAMAGLYNRLFYSVMGNNNIYLASIANEDDLNVYPHYSELEKSCDVCICLLSSSIFSTSCFAGGGCTGCLGNNFTPIYKLLFQTVGNANNIISKAGNINKLNPSFRKIIGELYFIRGYTYYRLARMYGQVPIVDNPDISFTIKKPSFNQLYNFIASDLLKAIDLLPKTNNDARIIYETPHRGSAKAILAEVYLTMGGNPVNDNSKYADAVRVAKEVIDSAAYFGFGLMPDLADLWNGHHSHNMEFEFGFHFLDSTKDLSKGLENLNSEQFAFTSYNLLSLHDPSLYPISTISKYYNECIVAADFYNSFPKNYRKEVSFQTRHVPSNTHSFWIDPHTPSEIFYDTIYLKHYDIINYCTDIAFKKFYTQFSIADSILLKPSLNSSKIYGHYSGGVVYFLRYAQTLLTYAEAMAHLGTIDASAYEAVNQVRRRANKVDLFSPSQYDLKPGLSTEQFLDSVVQERAWELCAEPEGRWFDMVRLGLTKDLVKIKQKQGLIVYPIPSDRNTFFLPVPAQDTLLNPNLK